MIEAKAKGNLDLLESTTKNRIMMEYRIVIQCISSNMILYL